MKYKLVLLSFFYFLTTVGQEDKSKSERIVINGYVQSQYQNFFIPDSVGAATKYFATFSGGNFANRFTSNRFTVRRGRLNISHNGDKHKAVFSIDLSEKGLSVKDAYAQYTEPYLNSFTFKAGVFSRPFGQEIELSSSIRETPERARLIQTIFPNERDLGFGLNFNMPEESIFPYLNFKTAIVNGNSVAYETDNYKDWLGRIGLNFNNNDKTFTYKCGFSWYRGFINHIYEPVDTVASNTMTKYYIYKFQNISDLTGRTKMGFVLDSAASVATGRTGGKVERNYTGIDSEISFKTPFGKLIIRGEYIWGTQPVAVSYKDVEQAYIVHNGMHTFSPTGPFIGVSWPMYDQPQPYNPVAVGHVNKFHHTFIRKFNGGYFYLIQEIFNSSHQIVFKYDWYDPNSEVAGKDIFYDEELYLTDPDYIKPYLTPADIKFETFGIGINYFLNENLKLCIYYEYVQNEKAKIDAYQGDLRIGRMPAPGFTRDLEDNVFTFRLQYKF